MTIWEEDWADWDDFPIHNRISSHTRGSKTH